jgi:hypothetical protein
MNDSNPTRSKRRLLQWLLLVLSLIVAGSPTLMAGERPEHYFTGRVCKGKDGPTAKRGSHRCKKAIKDATVTIHNSRGRVISTLTDSDGYYTLDVIPLLGTDDDYVKCVARKRVGLQISGLVFKSDSVPSDALGATILLPKERIEKIRIH